MKTHRPKSVRAALTLAALLAFTAVEARAAEPPKPEPAKPKPRIEVAFVLDTTGSMGGLIEGAKTKIWSIANDMIRAKPTPEIKIGLVAYRDRGDAYVTQVVDLSSDIDAVYGRLRELHADGGGDTPESVNQALADAVNKLSWSQDRNVLKTVFLVGDAPPHMDYPQDVLYPVTLQAAVKKDLLINTIQCGNDPDTARIWQEIARLGEGKYVALGQTGDMVASTTPLDAEIAKVARDLGSTAIGYGDADRRAALSRKVEVAAEAPAPVAADKAAFGARGGAEGAVVTGEGDLVADIAAGKTSLDKVAPQNLPEPVRALAPEERADYVAKQLEKRKELQSKMNELVTKRDAYLADERERLAKTGAKDSFDEKVTEAIRAEAKTKGIEYSTSK